jgi:hypothetical protein
LGLLEREKEKKMGCAEIDQEKYTINARKQKTNTK